MKHKLTRITALMLAVIMSFSMLLVPVQAASFTDVPEKAWYKAAVDYVSEKGWMNGVGEMTFAPTMDVTRAMFVTLLAAYADEDVDNNSAAFTDTGAGKWYTGSAAWAAGLEIVKGIGDGRFAPNRAITRQDLCVMLYKYLHVAGIELKADADRTYADFAGVSAYAKEAVSFCAASGLVTGFEDSTFRPKNTATRAQVAQILMRLDQLRQGEELPEDPMPAQSFDGAAGEDMSVSVNAPQGALPENTNMTVSRVTDEAALAAIEEKINGRVYAAADISFSKDEAEIEPAAEVEVQISLDGLENLKNPTVVHVKDDNSVEYVAAELISTNRAGTDKALRFYAKDFSVYAVIDDPSGNNAFTVTVNFYVRKNQASGPSSTDSDWELINKQIIRSNQIDAAKDNDDVLIFDPGVPELKSTQAFEGWARTKTFTDNDDKLSVADMNAKIKADYKSGTLNASVEKSYYAEVYDVVYITYHDQKGTVLETQFEHVDSTRKINKQFIKSYSPFKDDQAFFGWIPAAGIKTDENGKLLLGDYPEYTDNAASLYYKLYDANNAAGTTYEITYEANANNLDVYPYLQKGYWLIYDTNIDGNNTANNFDDSTSASYTGPKLYRAGENTVAPTQPTRTGYTFGGWYTDPSMRTEFTFGSPLTATTTIYAKWTPDETTYTVVFMLQNPTDPATVSDVTDNTYAYYDSVERNWTGTYTTKVKTGDTVSAYTSGTVNDKYLITGNITNSNYYNLGTRTIAKLGSDYFVYSAKNTGESVRVKGDGSTTLNIYYDRKTVTINFRTGGSYSEYDYSDYSNYYYGQYQYFGDNGSGYAVALTLTPTNGTWSTTTSSSGTLLYRVRYNNATFKRKDTGATYSGSVYTYTSSTSDSLDSEKPSITGLYGAPITDDMCPTLPENFEWAYNSDLASVMSANPTTFEAPNGYTGSDKNNITLVLKASYIDSVTRTLHYMSQDPETGVWESWKDDYPGNIYNLIQGNRVGRTYIGYNLSRDSRVASRGFVDREGQASHSIGFNSGAGVQMTGNEAWAYYRLNVHNLVFISNNQTVRECSVRYNETLAKYEYTDPANYTAENPGESYIPTSPKAGVYFVGWYADPAYKTKFDFEHGVMGDEAVTVYAKWEEMRFRAILDFTGGDPDVDPADIHFPGNQATAFRLDYLEQIQSSSIQACARDGYVLMGWYYYDKNGKEHEYDFSMGATEDMADMTYGTQGADETDEAFKARMAGNTRKGTDPFNANNPTWNDTWDTDWETHDYSGEYAAAGYANAEKMREARSKYRVVRGLIMIYAKWRVDPDAVADAKVTYHGDHDKLDTGYFETDGQPHIWIDPKSYGDKSQAYAQAASVPETEGEQFLYWEVLRPVKDENGEYVKDANGEIVFEPTGEKAYPGQTFEVDLDDAVKTRTYIGGVDPNHEHQLEAVAATTATCTTASVSAHYRCTICGKLFTDETGETETTLNALTTQGALGHDVEDVAWSYDSTGHWQVCKREGCGAHVNDAAHTMVEDMSQHVDPAIGSTGFMHEECSVCGYEKDTVLPALTGYTVTYHVPSGQTAPAAQTKEADTEITLPTMLDSGNYHFEGWVTAEILTATNTKPTILTGAYTVNANADLYAVYSYTEGSGEYERVTSAPADWTGNYVITYLNNTSMYVMKGMTPSSNGAAIESSANASSYSAAGVSLSGTTLLSNVSNNYVFTLAKHGSYYSIQNVATGTYLGMDSGCGAVCGYTTYTSGDCDWTPGAKNNVISAKNSNDTGDSDSYPYLSYSTQNSYFWAGSSGGTATSSIYWWKETTTTTTYYTTVFGTTPGAGGNAVTEPEVEVVREEKLNEALLTENADRSITAAARETAGLASVTPAPVVTASTTVASWNCDTVDNVSDWSIIDADGDGYNWRVYTSATSYTHDASDGCLLSYSYYSSTALTPDNWAVSPAINVPANGTTTLTFWARGSHSSYYAENFEVRALTAAPTSSNYTSGTVVMSETTTTASWTQYTVDLSSYKGQTIYLEFRHFDTEDMLALGLDDIIITNVVLPKLTINYQYENGTQAAETYVQEYAEGTEYRVVSPTIPGYTCDKPIVSDTMGASDVTVTVTYTAVEVEEEEWEPTTVIKPGEDYLIAYMINGTPYLLVNYNVSATNHYYYSYTGTSSTSTLGYLAPAVVDSQTGYITGVSGAATNLNYCKWLFETDAGGKITSSYESGRMLYWNNNGVYPNTTGDSWVWTVTNEANNLGTMHNVYNDAHYYFTTRSSTGSTSYSSGTPYAGIYSTAPASGNIRLYKRHVDEDTTWTVKFVNYNYTSLATEGYPDQPITNGQTVDKPTEDPTRNEDYEFAGWYIIGQDEPYDFTTPVTKDLTLQARYTMVYTYTYNLHLRAVYGMRNTTGKTHIYWYANDGTDAGHGVGAGDRFEQNEIDMNMAYSIPFPSVDETPDGKLTWTGGAWQPNQSQSSPIGLTYVGHTFLGWARVNTTGAGTTGTAHPNLTEDDLYLKWDAENNRYLYRQESRDGTVSWTNATAVTDVYADESQPYHDMYAVWSSHVFYVYHSSSGILQAFDLPISTAGSGSMIGTFDITKLVPDGYLYGGYYSTYGGVNMDAVEAARGASTGWSTGTLVSTNWSEIAELNTAEIAAVDFHAYDGSSLKNGTNRFWTKADAYNVDNLPIGMTAADVNGETMKPRADAIYYLKEVPADQFLRSKYAFVLRVKTPNTQPDPGTEDTLAVDDLYLLSVLDDNNYSTSGYRLGADYQTANDAAMQIRTSLATKLRIIQSNADGSTTTTNEITPVKLGAPRGYLSVYHFDSVPEAGDFAMIPGWKTLDGVEVYNAPLKVTVGTNNVTNQNIEIAGPKMLYVNPSSLNEWWFNDNAQTRAQFYDNNNNGGSQIVMDQVGTSSYYSCEIPDGYNRVRIQRYVNGNWTNESVMIDISQTQNCIETFWIQEFDNQANAGVTWKTFVP